MPEGTQEVQPPENGGQGAPEANGLYPDLSSLPDQIRDQVAPLFKEWEGNVTRRFQEAADYRKQWEPYEELGLKDIDMQELQDLLEFRQIAGDEDSFRKWYEAVGRELGIAEATLEGESGGTENGLTPETVQQMVKEMLEPLQTAQQQQESERRLSEAETFLNSKLDELKEKHGEFDRDAVCRFALAHEGQDAIDKGFADYQRLVGEIEKGAFQSKLDAPEVPERGGRPPIPQAGKITSFEDAAEAAKAVLRAGVG